MFSNNSPLWLWIQGKVGSELSRGCGERSWGRRGVLSVDPLITACLNGVSGRQSPNSQWHVEWYWWCTILRRMEKIIQVMPCVLSVLQMSPRSMESVICDVGMVRVRNELCKHLCNYFVLCSFSIQLHQYFIQNTCKSYLPSYIRKFSDE